MEDIKQCVNSNAAITGRTSHCISSDNYTPSDYLFRNLRELLWYWKEYYGKRGRDRLSLEFGTRIPSQEWIHVVNILCTDNYSTDSTNNNNCALLTKSFPLPLSPYYISSHPTCFQEWSKINPMNLNYTHLCLLSKAEDTTTNTNNQNEYFQQFI